MPDLRHLLLVPLAACAELPSHTPAIVDHGDGTYSLSAAPERDETTTMRRGALTWTYLGQARHAWSPHPLTEATYVSQPYRARTDEERLLGLVREDADGSRWQVTAVDLDAVRDQVAAHDARSVEVARGLTLDDPARVAKHEPAGVQQTITLNGWQHTSCSNHFWDNDDDRVAIAATTSRRKAMVEIGRVIPGVQCPYDGDYLACIQATGDINWCKAHVQNCDETAPWTTAQCSGVILRSQWVLTAAHCLHDLDMNPLATSSIQVRRADGVDSWLTISNKFLDVGFESDANFDPTDDWALVKLSSPLTAPYYDMDISGASDTTLEGLGAVANYAFPAFAPSCSATNSMFMNTRESLGNIYSNKVYFQLDGGDGHSGSPVFYCPGGDGDNECEGEEDGHVIGIWSGWAGFETTFVGAKGPEQRTNAIAIMDNN